MGNGVRNICVAMMVAAAAVAGAQGQTSATAASAAGAQATVKSIYDIPVEPMANGAGGTDAKSLAPYKGKVLLIVNVASKCGFTKQYAGLEALNEKYKDRGLVVLGFPSNDFKNQEPGTEAEIVEFCKATYGVKFPLFGKVHVKGDEKAPLYKYLTEGDHPGKGEVTWNFNKFLVDAKGNVVAHFDSKVAPDNPELVTTIEGLLVAR